MEESRFKKRSGLPTESKSGAALDYGLFFHIGPLSQFRGYKIIKKNGFYESGLARIRKMLIMSVNLWNIRLDYWEKIFTFVVGIGGKAFGEACPSTNPAFSLRVSATLRTLS